MKYNPSGNTICRLELCIRFLMFTITDKIKSASGRFLKVRAEFKRKATPRFCNSLTQMWLILVPEKPIPPSRRGLSTSKRWFKRHMIFLDRFLDEDSHWFSACCPSRKYALTDVLYETVHLPANFNRLFYLGSLKRILTGNGIDMLRFVGLHWIFST